MMLRDTQPSLAGTIGVTASLYLIAGREAAGRLDPVAAAGAVRAAVEQVWAQVPPEAVRDALAGAALVAAASGLDNLGTVPGLYDGLTAAQYGRYDIADSMLELAAIWLGAGGDVPPRGPAPGMLLFASSSAFDRADDDDVLHSLSALLALAVITLGRQNPWRRQALTTPGMRTASTAVSARPVPGKRTTDPSAARGTVLMTARNRPRHGE